MLLFVAGAVFGTVEVSLFVAGAALGVVFSIQMLVLGRTLLRALVFWYAFLTSFWGAKTMVLSKREGLLPGPGLALSFWFPFFLDFGCCVLLSWTPSWLQFRAWTGVGFLRGCLVVFLLLFWLALSLLSWSLFCFQVKQKQPVQEDWQLDGKTISLWRTPERL